MHFNGPLPFYYLFIVQMNTFCGSNPRWSLVYQEHSLLQTVDCHQENLTVEPARFWLSSFLNFLSRYLIGSISQGQKFTPMKTLDICAVRVQEPIPLIYNSFTIHSEIGPYLENPNLTTYYF